MKKAILMSICLLLFSACAKADEAPVSLTSAAEPAVTSAAADEPSQEPETSGTVTETEEIALDNINIFEDAYDYLKSENFETPEGFDKKNDGIEYGEMTETEYYSETTKATRKCFVYTPPGYDESQTYPTLYLLHGIGGTHTEWLGGRPDEVLSNLIASGEAPPLIAVIPNVRAKEDDSAQGDMFGAENIAAFDNFINDLRDDLMPFIKENYSVSEKREETAITGLSMGGREALFIGVSMPETFGFVGAFCPAPGLMSENLGFSGQLTPEELTLPEEYKNNTFILINTGNQDSTVGENPLNYSRALENNGVRHAFYSIDGGHDFNVWKNGLYFFVKCIF